MSEKAWQPLIAVVAALGIPTAVAATWHDLIARHPIAALILAAGWLVACGIVLAVRTAMSGPAQRRLEQAGNAADRAAGRWISRYGHRYRRWVLDSRRYIDVKDLAIGGDHTPELDDVYVDVALVRRAPHQVPANPVGDIAEDATGRYSISEFLGHADPVVLAILGPPGCGKTTLLACIARRTTHARRRQRRIPVLLALREQAARITADSQRTLPEITSEAMSRVPATEPPGWWDQQIRRGRCVILLDGLDEVARDEDRRIVTRWVQRQISSYPGNDFVITSRPHGFTGPVIAQADILAVRPFTADQVNLFLNRWFLAIEKHATGARTDAQLRSVRIRASTSADGLIALLRATPALYALTVNPLLLTMIAMVHRYRALPASRADLYRDICQEMLSSRSQAKDLPEILPRPTKRKLLTTLAYQMMVDHISELSAGRALEILDPLMRRLPQAVSGQEFLNDVSRNGLLTEPAPGRYAFAHQTFQEYLAARHASDIAGHARTLINAVDDPWWRESILLYTATADADDIIRACLDKGTIRALALAFDCAEASSELAPDLRQRLGEARDRAFAENTHPQYRQLIAAVLAVRLSQAVTVTTAGSRICTRPVPADLYWLFLKDTQAIEPDNPCEPAPESPATGMWGREASAFVRWLNDLEPDASQVEFRLPDPSELELEQVAGEVVKRLPESVTGLWSRPMGAAASQLWVPVGHDHPHHITAETIIQTTAADTKNTALLAWIFTATALDTAFITLQLLRGTYAFKDADFVGTTVKTILTNARSRAIDLAHYLYRGHDNDGLARNIARNIASDLDRARDLDFPRDLDLARELAGDLPRALDLARRLVLILVRVLDLDLDLDLPCDPDRDLAFARDLARALDLAHVRSRARSFGLFSTLDPPRDVVRDFILNFDLDASGGRFASLAIRLLEMPDVPLTWVIEGPLGRATRAWGRYSSPPLRMFAERLTLLAGIPAESTMTAALDELLIESLHRINGVESQHAHADTAARPKNLVSRLVNAAIPLLESHRQPADGHIATVRVMALALAASFSGDDDIPDILRTLAATVTLLQRRADGSAPIGEGIVLALA